MFAEALTDKLQGIVSLTRLQIDLLEQHFVLLQRWNQVLNLTSVRNAEEIIVRHYAESLFLGAHLPAGHLTIGDIGSGAGFPGIPVAVLRPECNVALIEAHRRKTVFLREATRQMPNIRIVPARVEAIKEEFDWTIARAVKFENIETPAARLSERVALLGGESPPSRRCFTWNDPIRVPWGERRFLWLGTSFHVKQL